AKKPADRPASAAEVAQELRSVSQTVTVVTPARKESGSGRTISNRPLTLDDKEDSDGTVDVVAAPRPLAGSLWLTMAAFATAAVLLLFATSLLDDRERADRFEAAWLQALHSVELPVRRQAIRALGGAGGLSETGMQALVESLDDNNPDIREAAVSALGDSGAAARIYSPRLLKVQKGDPIPQVRVAAEEALEKIRSAPDEGFSAFSLALGVLLAWGIAGGVYVFMQRKSVSVNTSRGRAMQHSR
ncbi:MAG: HEAT repeat domain-containing protein, partial [Maioricimonas sp. JB049]